MSAQQIENIRRIKKYEERVTLKLYFLSFFLQTTYFFMCFVLFSEQKKFTQIFYSINIYRRRRRNKKMGKEKQERFHLSGQVHICCCGSSAIVRSKKCIRK